MKSQGKELLLEGSDQVDRTPAADQILVFPDIANRKNLQGIGEIFPSIKGKLRPKPGNEIKPIVAAMKHREAGNADNDDQPKGDNPSKPAAHIEMITGNRVSTAQSDEPMP